MSKKLVVLLASVVACVEGPEGPEGPQGPQGEPVAADPVTVIANSTNPQDASFHITGLGVLGTALRVGTSAPIGGTRGDVAFQITSNVGAEAAIVTATNEYADKSYLFFDRSRGTLAAPIDVTDGDHLARITARGYQTGAMRDAAALRILVDGAPTGEYVPGAFGFVTTNPAGGRAERVRISSTGNVGIATNAPTELLDVAGPVRLDTWRVFRKTGNNGTVSCDTFCQGPQWSGGTGTCMAAKNITDNVYVSCSSVTGLNHGLRCLCAGLD